MTTEKKMMPNVGGEPDHTALEISDNNIVQGTP